MNWKEFFKPTLWKITVFILVALLIFVPQSFSTTKEKNQTEELSIVRVGVPTFFLQIYHCTSEYSCTEDNEFCFCKHGYKTYDYNILFLVSNLLELYLTSCLIFIKKSLK
jgi:hypothetical protein